MINIVVDNYIRVSGLPRESFDRIVDRLTYPNPKFANALKYGQGRVQFIPRTLKAFKYEDGEIWLPRGYYMEFLSDVIATTNLPYQISDLRNKQAVNTPTIKASLRSYQQQMVDEAYIYPGPSFILQAPPGTGKTFTGLALAGQFGRKTLWITHTKELASQTRESAAKLYGVKTGKIGMVGQGKFNIGEFLTISMIQTLYRKIEKLADLKYSFGTVIVDEVHHSPANSWQLGTHMLSPETTFGLTATSYRNDGLTQLMFDCMGPVVSKADPSLLVQENVIVLPNIYMVETGIRFFGASYSSILNDVVDNEQRNELLMSIIQHIMKDPNNTLLVLSDRVRHVEELTQRSHAAGLSPLMMLGDMSKTNKTLAAERLVDKNVNLIIATYKLLSEGFDYPQISHVLFGTPFKDSIRVEQCIGRAQRVSPGKSSAFIIDLMDHNPMFWKQARVRQDIYAGLGLDVKSLDRWHFQ